MERQIAPLSIKAEPGELEAGAERRRHAARLLAPPLGVLRTGLAPRVCANPEAITFLADADDKEIDAAVSPCIEGKSRPDPDFLETLIHSCLDHKELGWTRTSAALSKTARTDQSGTHARRVAGSCATGKD